ncbi:MAG: peptidylprolyl isomerase, partial [Muribaculaceae bacterium]|nr:peptidylprolyl isomerase [Muribaculaceae bacterium]
MKHKLLIASLLAGCALLATAAKDPVLMDIAGKKIKLSEFEYLYHKNSQQQIEKETLDQYVNRFVTYKRKVADAEAAGLDTLPAFISEFNGYKTDIVKPFLEDTTVYNRLVNEAYERMTKNVDIDHFMYNFGRDFSDNKKQMAFVDSLRTCVLNGESWESIVEKYSIDPSKGKNKGHYGFITSGVFPYEFEKVVYETPVGEISHPFRTDFGIHMVRVNAVAPATEVHAQHILKSFQVPRGQQVSDSVKTATKQKIDSIYAVVASEADFEEVAKAESDDRGTKAKGGELPWFGRGRMVPQFDKMAFEMPVGTISQP